MKQTDIQNAAKILELVNALTAEECSSVEIHNDNPDFNGMPDCCVTVHRLGDGLEIVATDYRADSVLECLQQAIDEQGFQAFKKSAVVIETGSWNNPVDPVGDIQRAVDWAKKDVGFETGLQPGHADFSKHLRAAAQAFSGPIPLAEWIHKMKGGLELANQNPETAKELCLFALDPIVRAFCNFVEGRQVFDWRHQRSTAGVLSYGPEIVVKINGVVESIPIAWAITGKDGWVCRVIGEHQTIDDIVRGDVTVESGTTERTAEQIASDRQQFEYFLDPDGDDGS